MELVDTADLKSAGDICEGSSPFDGTSVGAIHGRGSGYGMGTVREAVGMAAVPFIF